MNQQGISFLEVIVVVAIIGITAALVQPNFSSSRATANVSSDFQRLTGQIEYLKTRARSINGTAVMTCVAGNVLSYQISSNRQTSLVSVDPNFATNLLENPSGSSAAFNVLSGNSTINSSICSGGKRAIFLSNGQSGVEGGGTVDMDVNYVGNKVKYPAYRVFVNPTTSFVQKYRWSTALGNWSEFD
jgi:Tfp pilus assembly protein FimT